MDKRYVFCLLSIYLNLENEDIFFFCRYRYYGDNMVVYKDILYRYSRLIFLFRIFLVLKDYFLGNFLIEKEIIYIFY